MVLDRPDRDTYSEITGLLIWKKLVSRIEVYVMDAYEIEVAQGQRFEFGKNWKRFLAGVDEKRVDVAVESICTLLDLGDGRLKGKRFLDIGSGSGLFSLAARRLEAEVCSFDYDPHSVDCTREMKRRFAPNDPGWRIERGSILDSAYVSSLGVFDVVYSWGVLHHTGSMWKALSNAADLVAPRGLLTIAVYNDQGPQSRRWAAIKRTYNRLPTGLKEVFGFIVMGGRDLRFLFGDILRGRPLNYVRRWMNYSDVTSRGMSRWHDWLDWVGGYPFEVAKPEEIFEFLKKRGFALQRLKTCGGGIGCNEFVFRRNDWPARPASQSDCLVSPPLND